MATGAGSPAGGSWWRGTGPELARRSLLMLPLFVVALIASVPLGVAALAGLGLHEGDLLLMAHNAGAWAAEVALTALILAAPLAGLWLAVAAIRQGAPRRAWVWLALHGVLVVWALAVFVDNVRMSYFPGG